jgi:hypothetical protein
MSAGIKSADLRAVDAEALASIIFRLYSRGLTDSENLAEIAIFFGGSRLFAGAEQISGGLTVTNPRLQPGATRA